MPKGFITCTLVGNLARDPEVHQTTKGVSITNMIVAVNRRRNGKDTIDWVRLVAFNQSGEFASKYLSKGAQVLVTGDLYLETWNDSSGAHKHQLVLQVNKLTPITYGSKDGNKGDGGNKNNEEVPF